MSASSANVSALTLTPLADSTFNDRVTHSGPFVVDASFQFVNVQDPDTIDSLAMHTLHDVVSRVAADFQ